jgi:hypothetical protein
MDTCTMIRELDEVIARAQSTVAREAALLDALPDCGLRRRKHDQVRAVRGHVYRLRKLRHAAAVRARDHLGSRLTRPVST